MSDAGGRPTDPAGSGEWGIGSGPGDVFAGLVLEGEVGRGGMGVIYRARDPELDRARALKVLATERSQDPEFRERFRRESRQAAAIEHPNVIPVFRAGEEAGHLYLVMRFVDGPSLADVLAERGKLPLDEAIDVVGQVAAGLDAAHAVGLVHRDVKPANVLLEGELPRRRAFLCDFGISKLASAATELTGTGQFVGTVDYVAPEQLEGAMVDRRADVYSLACVAYHAIAGAVPFSRDTQLATMFAHANAPRPDPGPGVPSKVREVLARGMSVKPDDRPGSAGEFAAELERAAGAASVARTERLAQPGRTKRRRRVIVGAGLAALAAVAAGAAVIVAGDGDDAAPPADAITTRAVDVDERPLDVTVGPGRVWTASPASKTVTSLTLDDLAPERYALGDAPAAVAIGFESIWVADRERDQLYRVDPATGALEDNVDVGAAPEDIAIGPTDVWVANASGNNVSRVDPSGGEAEVIDTIPVGARPTAVAVDDAGVWVANRDSGDVSFIDPALGQRTNLPIEVGQRPNDIAVGAGSVWVTDNFDGTVVRIDAERGEVAGEPITVGPLPRGVAFGLGSVWVALGQDGTVIRIDPETAAVVGEPIRVGDQPASIAVGPGSVWTADYGTSTLTELRLPR
jgi:streptogramin lyase